MYIENKSCLNFIWGGGASAPQAPPPPPTSTPVVVVVVLISTKKNKRMDIPYLAKEVQATYLIDSSAGSSSLAEGAESYTMMNMGTVTVHYTAAPTSLPPDHFV